MKASTHTLARAASVLFVLSLWGCTGNDSAAVPEPLQLGRADAAAYLVIPDLNAALQGVVDLTDAVKPGTMTLQQLRTQAGDMLGDPELSNLHPKKPVLLVALNDAEEESLPTLVALIPAREAAPYAQSLARLGMVTKYEGGLLLATTAPEALEKADDLRAMYDRIAETEVSASVRLYLHVGHLLETFGSLLEERIDLLISAFGMLQTGTAGGFGGPEGEEWIQMLLKAELKGFLALARQCNEVQVDLTVGGIGVKVDKVVVAKSGSALSNLFEKSALLQPTSFGILGAEGTISGVYALDADGSARLAKDVLAELEKDPDCARLFTPEIRALFEDVSDWWPERGSFSTSSSRETPYNVNAVLEVKDADKYLAVMEKFMNFAKPGTYLHDLYKSMGMDLQPAIKRDARTHAGVSVHRFEIFGKMEGGGLLTEEVLKSIPTSMEIAFVRDMGAFSYTPDDLNSLIDTIKGDTTEGELTLQAVRTFGAGRQVYFDYDVIAVMKSLGNVIPGAEGIYDKMSAGYPLVGAMTFDSNRAAMQLHIPIEFLRQVGKLTD